MHLILVLSWLVGLAVACGYRPTFEMTAAINAPGLTQSGCPAQRQYLASRAAWDAFWGRCSSVAPVPPRQLSETGVLAVCLGERPSGGGKIRALAYQDKSGEPVVILSEDPPGGGPLTVLSTPCAVFQIPVALASAEWRRVKFAEVANTPSSAER